MNRTEFLASLPSRIALACDVSTRDAAVAAMTGLEGHVACVKLGREVMNALDARAAIELATSLGHDVFADVKDHDIKTTVVKSVQALELNKPRDAELISRGKRGRVMFVNMHLGMVAAQTIRGFVETVEATGAIPLGVTLLTDIGDEVTQDLDFGDGGPTPLEVVLRFAAKGIDHGIKGIIASAQEAEALRREFGDKIIIVTPAIRPKWSAKNDQERVLTPTEAIQAGADILVIGRPLVSKDYDGVAPTPAARAQLVNEEVARALAA